MLLIPYVTYAIKAGKSYLKTETEKRADISSSSDVETVFPNLSLGSSLIVSWTPVVRTKVWDRTPRTLVISGHAGPGKILRIQNR